MGKSSMFSGLLERATSQLQLEPDWASILQICDCIRQQDVTPKFAVAAIKKKMFEKNPHVAKFALIVLEACMKNCGSGVHEEIGTKEFMEEMRNLIRTGQEPVKDKALELIQTWAHVFRNETKYKIITDTYNLMKMEGCQFPSFKESEAMFSADCAPAWAEGDVCHMCRVKFGTFLRQHHCRKCGQVFCRKCSSKESIIPQFGIEREVRVCDPCYYQLNPQSKSDKSEPKTASSSDGGDLPAEYLNSALYKESQAPPKRDPQQLKDQEEEELQLAMALSLSQEEAQKEKKPLARSWPSQSDGVSNGSSSSNSKSYQTIAYDDEPEPSNMDPDLARYLNRSYWEGRQQAYTSPSAPEQEVTDSPAPYSNQNNHAEPKKKKKSNLKSYQTLEKTSHVNSQPEEQVSEADQSSETLVNNFRSSLEMLSERMQTLSGKGKHIAMDATIQSLFQTVSAMHPQLLRLIEQQDGETEKYEALKVRLGLVKDARATLDDAREQHREKVRQQELEQDMLRRMQIEQKLELMRQQKAEYIAYQQRLQAERQMAMEQQQQQLRLQKYGPQSFPGQPFAGQFAVADGSSPYSSMGYMPPTSLPPQQAEGSPYSSLNYIPPSSGQGGTSTSIQGPTGPVAPNNMANQQPSYTQTASQSYPNQGFPENPAAIDNQVRSQSPRLGQPPQSYQQVDYSQYTPDMTIVNGHPQVPDYLQAPEQVPGSTYPGQPAFSSSSYQSQGSSQPPQYAQAANQQVPQGYLPQGNQTTYGSQQSPPTQFPSHQGHQLDTTGFGQPPSIQQPPSQQQPQPPLQPQQQQSLQPQHPMNTQQPMSSQQQQLYQPPPQHQQQTQPQHQQPQHQPPPSHHHQLSPQHQQQQPQQQQSMPPPQQQQPHHQPPPSQHQQQQPPQHQQPSPHHQPQQQQQPPLQHQMYEPQPQQYQAPYSNPQQYQQPPPNQYYQQPQPSGPPPQRQLSDLELISFD